MASCGSVDIYFFQCGETLLIRLFWLNYRVTANSFLVVTPVVEKRASKQKNWGGGFRSKDHVKIENYICFCYKVSKYENPSLPNEEVQGTK